MLIKSKRSLNKKNKKGVFREEAANTKSLWIVFFQDRWQTKVKTMYSLWIP